ncbi:hypothetical protein RI367_000591 [Sorochytrium milnesiophthora]
MAGAPSRARSPPRSPVTNLIASAALHGDFHAAADEDVEVPSGRADPLATYSFREIQRPPPAAPSIPPPSRHISVPESEYQALKDTVDRLNAALADRLLHQPALLKSSAHGKLATVAQGQLLPAPLLTFYDHKLGKLEQTEEILKSELQSITAEAENVVHENRRLQQQATALQEGSTAVELYSKENALLTEQLNKSEELLKEALREGARAKTLEGQLAMLKTLTQTQSETIDTLTESSKSLERKLADANSSLAAQKRVAKQAVLKMENAKRDNCELKEDKDSMADDMARLQRWAARTEQLADEYRDACEAVGIDPDAGAKGALSAKLRSLKAASKENRRKHEATATRLAALEKDVISATQKAVVEGHKKDAALRKTKEQLEELVQMVERARYERDQAKKQCEQMAREVAEVEDKRSRLKREKETELSELVQRTNEQLRIVRRDYETDKDAMQAEIDALRKSKVDLQCEVGVLIRDKRAVEYRLNDVSNDIVLQRDKFRATLGI